jgi:hypothetical protein
MIEVLDYSVLAFLDTCPLFVPVCSVGFPYLAVTPRFFSLVLSLFVEEAFWPRYARIQHEEIGMTEEIGRTQIRIDENHDRRTAERAIKCLFRVISPGATEWLLVE